MPNFAINTIKILRSHSCITSYANYTFYHPLIVFNSQQNLIVDYVNMDKKTINEIIELNNSFDRKFLKKIFDVPNNDIYKFNDNIIGYQFREDYLSSSIKINNQLIPYHNLSNESEESDKTYYNFPFNNNKTSLMIN